ncbi:MgtC/SapB family protein [Niabella terrae]
MQYVLEPDDIYKALFALIAGLILGLERELKDKAAGIKTISVICLGACLFTVLSLKSGNQFTDGARIASYVVAGVGFLGAGVIFKDGHNVSGLTTASVIWIAAAIGMAIGYGEIFLAAVFLLACMLIVYTSRYLNLALFSGKTNKVLVMVLPQNSWQLKGQIIEKIRQLSYRVEELKLESYPDKLIVSLDIMVVTTRLPQLEAFLIEEKRIERFEL